MRALSCSGELRKRSAGSRRPVEGRERIFCLPSLRSIVGRLAEKKTREDACLPGVPSFPFIVKPPG